MKKPVTCRPCVECGGAAVVVDGAAIYPHRPDLRDRKFWRCGCGAYVGCHRGTIQPLGSPAGPETRTARGAAHKSFDELWQRKMKRDRCRKWEARSAAYRWLSEQMGMTFEDTHIAMFTAEQCRRVVEICAPFNRREAA